MQRRTERARVWVRERVGERVRGVIERRVRKGAGVLRGRGRGLRKCACERAGVKGKREGRTMSASSYVSTRHDAEADDGAEAEAEAEAETESSTDAVENGFRLRDADANADADTDTGAEAGADSGAATFADANARADPDPATGSHQSISGHHAATRAGPSPIGRVVLHVPGGSSSRASPPSSRLLRWHSGEVGTGMGMGTGAGAGAEAGSGAGNP